MSANYITGIVAALLENTIFACFLFRRLTLRAIFPARLSFVWLTLLASASIHLCNLANLGIALHQAAIFLIWICLESCVFQETFSEKAFHACLLTFINLFAEQAYAIFSLLFLSAHAPFPYLETLGAFRLPIYDDVIVPLYLAFECLIMLLFLFALNKVPKIPERFLGLLVAVTAAALITSAYFLSTIITTDSAQMSIKQRVQYSALSTMILMLFFSTLLLHQLTGRIYAQNMELAEQLHQREKNEERNKTLLQSAQSLHRWKHDYANHLIAMKGLAEQGAYSQLARYIENQIDCLPQTFPTTDTGHQVIDAILTNKYAAAQMERIPFRHSVILPEQLPLNDIEVTGILGNLLDNALDACRQGTVKFPYITFTMKPKRDMLYISVENSSDGNYHYDSHGNLKTTKEEKEMHGKGLSNIINITKAHAGFYEINPEPEHFSVNIFIPL